MAHKLALRRQQKSIQRKCLGVALRELKRVVQIAKEKQPKLEFQLCQALACKTKSGEAARRLPQGCLVLKAIHFP